MLKRAQQHIASPHILAVWRDVQFHHHDAVETFWADLKGPIVDSYPDHEDALVTFVARSRRPYAGICALMY